MGGESQKDRAGSGIIMLMSLSEAHIKFKDSLTIGRAKFCELRPTHLKLFDQIPHQFKCLYVAITRTWRLLLVALKDHTVQIFQGSSTELSAIQLPTIRAQRMENARSVKLIFNGQLYS